jgi:hypothetical protein
MARLPSAKMADALLGGVGRLHGFAIAAERAVVEAAVMVVHRSARLPMTRHTARTPWPLVRPNRIALARHVHDSFFASTGVTLRYCWATSRLGRARLRARSGWCCGGVAGRVHSVYAEPPAKRTAMITVSFRQYCRN